MTMTGAEIVRRCRERKRGIDIPKLLPGPKEGYKQTDEHIRKRKRFGAKHHAWKGEDITIMSGRCRALRRYPIKPCERCSSLKSERHHRDDNTKNNQPFNIQFLCRRCHMIEDGRYDRFIELAKENQPRAVAARWH